MSTVAKTILSQLGGGRFIVMTGAKNLIGSENALSFKIGGGAKDKINGVRVVLNGDDTYTMTFMRMGTAKTGYAHKIIHEIEGVYCDQLQEIFTEKTGFYTRM